MKQLPLDFSNSSSQRRRKINKLEHKIKKTLPTLFDQPPKIDIHYENINKSIIIISGSTPEITIHWLSKILDHIEIIKPKELRINNYELDKLLYLIPPSESTFDSISSSLAKIIVGDKLKLKPIIVRREKNRLQGRSKSWPKGSQLRDIPWEAILASVNMGIKVEVEENATKLYVKKMGKSRNKIASAKLSGSMISISTDAPKIFERLDIKGISYNGEKGNGEYKLPLLLGRSIQNIPGLELSDEVDKAINYANRKIMSPTLESSHPWKLHAFQLRDLAKAIRIIETTGGVLLAGEMGSGKTIVSLSLVEKLDLYPVLIIAPLSAFSTWEKHLKELKKSYYLGNKASKDTWYEIRDNYYDVVILSYDRLSNIVELIERKKFKTILADEIQRIRTYSSRRSKALRQLSANSFYRIGLSGTPLTNTAKDLLPVGSFLTPNEWRARSKDKDLTDIYPEDSRENVSAHLNSMMVRRRIEDTGAKLPKRNTHRIFVDLTLEQIRAIEDIENEVRKERKEGIYEDNKSRMHAFAKLQKMRAITNNPKSAEIDSSNPKLQATINMAKEFIEMGRKGVIFCSDRETFRDLERILKDEKIGYVGIWGATPSEQRIINEKKFHNDPEIKVVICTIQAGSESWSASPTATWLISTSYMYAPAILDQMEARVYRLNSDINGPDIEISYIHAKSENNKTLDDRMVEILDIKRELFANIIDQRSHIDQTKIHISLSDLLYLLTGDKDNKFREMEKDSKRRVKNYVKKKENIKNNYYKKNNKNQFKQDKVDKLLYGE